MEANYRSGETWRGELCNRKKNGEIYWERTSISPIHDAQGQPSHFVAVKEDITDRKRAEEALAKSQAKLIAPGDRQDRILGMGPGRGPRTPLARDSGHFGLGPECATVSFEAVLKRSIATTRIRQAIMSTRPCASRATAITNLTFALCGRTARRAM